MDNNKSKDDLSLVIGVGLLFGVMVVYKVGNWIWFEVILKLNIWTQAFIISLIGTSIVYLSYKALKKTLELNKKRNAIFGPSVGATYCGKTNKGQPVFIKPKQRTMHTQVIGTTNAGKTESVILPWAIQDMKEGRGLVLIDGKADSSMLNKLWAYANKLGRENDFRLFSLGNIDESHQFNPLIGGTPEEISERVFNSFEFENSYYRSLQFEVFSQAMRIFSEYGDQPTFLKLHQAITDKYALAAMAAESKDLSLRNWAEFYRDLPSNERSQRISGLTAALSHFSFGKTACLFNIESAGITLEHALGNNLIVYFQLPVLLSPFLGKATGKMVLQALQSAIANRHRGRSENLKFFSVFLDDFSEYLYPGFVSVLNKSRSANVGIVFAHQALGDIQTLGDPIANSILTNANIKVFMRGNDPVSAEYFSKVIGTAKTTKYTERKKEVLWSKASTGDTSAREVEEFIIHPNRFKRELGVGEAIMIVPHEMGSEAINIKFDIFPDLKAPPLNPIPKQVSGHLKFLNF